VAGYGDTLSFGITRAIRNSAGIGSVNYCSTAYKVGETAGILHSFIFGWAQLGRHALANGAKSLYAESRTFGTVSRRWHKMWGGAEDLDHFFHPNVRGVRGWWNSGFNLLPLSPWVNRQLLNPWAWKKAQRWIPQLLRGGAQATVLGTYGAVPTAVGTIVHDGMSDECACN
jgi:hypothetical protein